jgi:hypothetical protein
MTVLWGSTTDIICACLLFFVLRTALREPISMATDPNVVIVDTKSKILFSMLQGELIDVEENVKLQIENLLTELSKRSDTIKEIQGTILALPPYLLLLCRCYVASPVDFVP